MAQSREEIIEQSIKRIEEMQKTADDIFNQVSDSLQHNDPITRRWGAFSSDLDELCIKYSQAFRSLQNNDK